MKKILLGFIALLIAVATIPLFAAYEAYIINVKAHIENALSVTTKNLDFGTVFPQQYKEKSFAISLSDSFISEDSVDGVEYIIKQKPKPLPTSYTGNQAPFANHFEAHQYCLNNQGDSAQAPGYQPDYYDYCYLTLCPYLSKLPQDDEEGDTGVPSYFVEGNPNYCIAPGRVQAAGVLSKSDDDLDDNWNIDLKVPPIDGYVGQDWPAGCPVLDENDKDYGCDLWVEITRITEPPSYCGDGAKNLPNSQGQYEECDGLDGVGLHQRCENCILINLTYCGDNIKQTPNDNGQNEQCDGTSGVGPHQTCTPQCTIQSLTYCGDGVKQNPNGEGGNEQCDGTDGVLDHYTCTPSCTLEYIPYCGDGNQDQGEECDGQDGVPPNYTCTPDCTLEYVPYCGDGNQDPGEQCDGQAGVPPHYTCESDCTLEYVPYCGDGNQDPGEQCDGQAGVPPHYTCTQSCTLEYIPYCGDGNQDQGEECDGQDGVLPHYTCESDCTLEYVPYCGDSIINQPSEQCDGLAGVGPHQICTNCTLQNLTYCGDGVWQPHNDEGFDEQCDGTSGVGPHQTCTPQCTIQNLTYCGDGVKQNPNGEGGNEQCDGTDGVPANYTCTQSCTLEYIPYCGDGLVNQQSEQCDGQAGVPEHYTCTPDCTLEYVPYCGDGNQDPGEQCDGQAGLPPHYTCTQNCTLEYVPYCGDNLVNQPSEECDGQAGVGEHQSCNPDCTIHNITYCGDGIKQSPNEEGTGGQYNDGYEDCDGTDVPSGYDCDSQNCTLISQCFPEADFMLVLDRSGSINSSELTLLKNAAKDFVDTLEPSQDGVHMGQSSFSNFGSLDLHLTYTRAVIDGVIDSIVASGMTNLKEGILWANEELRNTHIHERPAIPDYMIIITDGVPNRPTNETVARAQAIIEANNAKAAGVTIFVVGVGTTPETSAFLRDNIASGADHYYDVSDYSALNAILQAVASCQ